MKLTFLGAAQTVTGSRILFDHRHFLGLVDCGLFQGSRELRDLNWNDQPELLQAQCILLTHVHIDHCGYLPRLFKQGFRKPIYCSKPSADLLKVMLLDAAKLQEEDSRFANEAKHSSHDPALPLYETHDALGCLELLHPVDWQTWIQLTPALSFQMVRSGHILGSGYVQLSFSDETENRTLTFSGDVGGPRSEILRDPAPLPETDFLITESTYGNRSLSRTNIAAELAAVVNKVFSRQGTLIIPSFAVGRTQDLLILLDRLKKQNQIPPIPIYLDSPMAHEVTSVYLKNIDELKNFDSENDIESILGNAVCKPVLTPDESMMLCMSEEPKIVISASGMLQGGRVLHHLKAKLPSKKNGVLFVGFQAQGTKGRLLKEGLLKIRIHHRQIDVEAEIFKIDGLSAHADSDELLQWMGHLRTPPRMTLVNHGELEASEALAYRIKTELNWANVKIPHQGEVIDLKIEP